MILIASCHATSPQPNKLSRAVPDCSTRIYSTEVSGTALDHQIPDHQKQTQPAAGIEHVLGRALPLCRLLELLVPSAHVLRHQVRIRHQLVDVRRLRGQIIDQLRLEL